jgi:hypothetical protein
MEIQHLAESLECRLCADRPIGDRRPVCIDDVADGIVLFAMRGFYEIDPRESSLPQSLSRRMDQWLPMLRGTRSQRRVGMTGRQRRCARGCHSPRSLTCHIRSRKAPSADKSAGPIRVYENIAVRKRHACHTIVRKAHVRCEPNGNRSARR